jgi:ABC-type oligopeptide transport system ATPase subunit
LNAIEIENLVRTYKTTTGIIRRRKKEILALDNINLSVQTGDSAQMELAKPP